MLIRVQIPSERRLSEGDQSRIIYLINSLGDFFSHIRIEDERYIICDIDDACPFCENEITLAITECISCLNDEKQIEIKKKILFNAQDRSVPYSGDIISELLEQGQIVSMGQGQFAYGQVFLSLMRYFDDQFNNFGAQCGANEVTFPSLIPVETLDRCDYFTSFPQFISFVHHLPENYSQVESFVKDIQKDSCSHIHFSESDSEYVLSPAVCYHLYQRLQDYQLETEGSCYRSVGKCYRYESVHLTDLERLWEFTMREIVFVGSDQYVEKGRERSLEWIKKFLTDIGLKCRIETADDPFFLGDARKKQIMQRVFNLKFEIIADLPYKGKGLAIGSVNRHNDFFGTRFHISQQNNRPACTGCTAFGIERFTYAFFSQYGLNPNNWPELVKKSVILS